MNKAILIDTPVRLVREIEIDFSSLPAVVAVIGCHNIEGHRFPGSESDWFYCDEEGALADPPLPAFKLEGFPDLIHGRALVFGSEGPQEVDPAISVEEVEQRVSFAYSVDLETIDDRAIFKSDNIDIAINFDDIVADIEQAIASLEALPVRTGPEEDLMNDLKRLLRDYRKGEQTL